MQRAKNQLGGKNKPYEASAVKFRNGLDLKGLSKGRGSVKPVASLSFSML